MIEGSFNGTEVRVIQEFQSMGPRVTESLTKTVNEETSRLGRHVLGKLGQVLSARTGRLLGSTRWEPARVTPDRIEASVLSARGAAGYGRVHEFGGTFAYARRVRGGSVQVTATYPERSYMRASLADRRASILEALVLSITKTVEGNV